MLRQKDEVCNEAGRGWGWGAVRNGFTKEKAERRVPVGTSLQDKKSRTGTPGPGTVMCKGTKTQQDL